jgi:polysaccharide export outer membrane protein
MNSPRTHLICKTLIALLTIGGAAFALANAANGDSKTTQDYTLGPGDQIVIRAPDAEEISEKPVRIGNDGFVSLPVVGRFRVAGLKTEELEAELAKRLTILVKKPQVSVAVLETQSQSVSVIGEVRNPGVYQLQGRKTLVQVLSSAGGLQEDAGFVVKITRRMESGAIPLPKAVTEPTEGYSVAEIPLHEVMTASVSAENILIMPDDVIIVPRAEMVYVIGEVGKAGGITLGDQQKMTVLQALSLAAGLARTAKPTEAKILRVEPGKSTRRDIPVDLKTILAGKTNDIPMQAEDILFVPNSSPHSVAVKALESVLQVGTGVAILSATHY